MVRNFNIYINPELGVISQTEGDGSFFLGDNNRITIIPDVKGKYYVSISGNIPGKGTYIANAIEQEDGSYVINSDDMNGFLVKVGKVNCNLHISNENGERLTTLAFQIESKLSYDREGSTIVAPTNVKDLNDFYIALDIVKNLNIEEIEDAVAVVESLDIEKIEEALEIVNTLDGKIEEIDVTLADAKETDEALKAVLTEINRQLEAGELRGEKGDKGDKGDPGESIVGPAGPAGADGKDGSDYVLTDDDKTEIANAVYSMFTSAEDVTF